MVCVCVCVMCFVCDMCYVWCVVDGMCVCVSLWWVYVVSV